MKVVSIISNYLLPQHYFPEYISTASTDSPILRLCSSISQVVEENLLDLSLVNAHILYNETVDKKMSQLHFRVAVAKDLLEGIERLRHHHTPSSHELPTRLTERAFPEAIPDKQRSRLQSLQSQRSKAAPSNRIQLQAMQNSFVPVSLL